MSQDPPTPDSQVAGKRREKSIYHSTDKDNFETKGSFHFEVEKGKRLSFFRTACQDLR